MDTKLKNKIHSVPGHLVSCACCGTFYSLADDDADRRFCQQCKFVGCNLNRAGDRCRLSIIGLASPHTVAPVAENKLEVLS